MYMSTYTLTHAYHIHTSGRTCQDTVFQTCTADISQPWSPSLSCPGAQVSESIISSKNDLSSPL